MSVKHKMVYRVESRASGSGPFTARSARTKMAMNWDMPPPRNDGSFLPDSFCELDNFRGMRFGAPTKSVMKEWIVEPKVLRSHSYLVRKYKVPVDKVVASQIQCIFKKKDAQCVAEYDIVEFMKGKKE